MRLFVLVVFGILVASVVATPFKVCKEDDHLPLLKAKQVELTPENPKRGDDAVFTISGKIGRYVKNATLYIIVYTLVDTFLYKGEVKLTTEKHDLCDYTTCPLKKGKRVVKYKRHLPAITPPGNYRVKVMAIDSKERLILCVEVEFGISTAYPVT
eukprot:g3755.t1